MALVMENQQPLAPMLVVPAPPLPPPPPPLPPPPQAYYYKHRCKVCKKGFMCGRALGGHMRAHGVTDDGLSADDALDDDDDDDDSGPCGGAWDSSEAAGGTAAAAAAATKRMSYSLRTNAGRHKNCRACENCGKEFTSWKSLLDHGRCTHDKEKDGLNIAGADVDGEDEEDLAIAAGGWSKGKRTRRTKVIVVDNGSQVDEPLPATSREEEDLANCLVMLASSRRGAQPPAIVDVHQQPYASTSKQDERAPASKDEQGFLVPPQPISAMLPPQFKFLAPPQVMPSPVVPRGLFECKACKKVFTSHQALGGHRASHKKVKGCFAAKLDSSRNDSPQPSAASPNDDNIKVVVEAIPAAAIVDTTEPNGVVDGNAEGGMVNARTTAAVVAGTSSAAPEMAIMQVVDEAPSSSTASPFKKKGKVHECSICHRVFMSGQALGGHKRCHWLTTGAGDPTAVAKLPFVPQDHAMHAMYQQLVLGSIGTLDLNVPMDQFADADATGQAGELNESMTNLNAPAASLYMHPWAGHTNAGNMHNTAATNGHYDLPEGAATEDEADSTSAKRAKMSDLKDMNMSGETSPWLQVGIALPSSSETNERLLKPEG